MNHSPSGNDNVSDYIFIRPPSIKKPWHFVVMPRLFLLLFQRVFVALSITAFSQCHRLVTRVTPMTASDTSKRAVTIMVAWLLVVSQRSVTTVSEAPPLLPTVATRRKFILGKVVACFFITLEYSFIH